MTFRFLSSIVGLTALWLVSASVQAQTTAPSLEQPKASSVDKDPYTPEQHEAMKLFGQGFNKEVIEKATAALQKGDKTDPFWLYWRGYARRRLSQLDGAREDLQGLGDYAGWPKFPPASKLVKDLDVLLELRPPHMHEVRDGDTVIFRVYSGEDEELFRAVVDALPKAYAAAAKFTGADTEELPVFLFDADKYAEFSRFYTTLRGGPIHFWWRVLSHSGAITISRADSNGHILTLGSMVGNLSHEMTHQLMGRKVGIVKDFPNWFNEGAAQSGEAISSPGMYQRNNQRMDQLLAQGAILPLEALRTNATFHDAEDEMKMGGQKGDPYAQGLSMTRYLGILLKGETMSSFLTTMRDKRSFEAALKEGTGLTLDQFYQSWLDALSKNDRNAG